MWESPAGILNIKLQQIHSQEQRDECISYLFVLSSISPTWFRKPCLRNGSVHSGLGLPTSFKITSYRCAHRPTQCRQILTETFFTLISSCVKLTIEASCHNGLEVFLFMRKKKSHEMYDFNGGSLKY